VQNHQEMREFLGLYYGRSEAMKSKNGWKKVRKFSFFVRKPPSGSLFIM
jgi:hypothetical protein